MPRVEPEDAEPSPQLTPGATVPGTHPGDRYIRFVSAADLPLRPVAKGVYVAEPTPPVGRVGRAWHTVKRLLIGRPLSTAEAPHERLSKVKALAVFSSDALSSTAYATEEILRVLILAGMAAYSFVLPIGLAIVLLLAIVVISYRQTIQAYPHGGGTYIVTKDNLGSYPGLVAAAALLTDYVLTVAVSTSAGVAAVTSAFEQLWPLRVELAVASITLLTIANLRGVRESGTIFALPTYMFITSMYVLLVIGAAAWLGWGVTPRPVPTHVPEPVHPLTLFLVLRAFSSGSAALTGVEAVADGVPAFKPPEAQNARVTLAWMGVILGTLFFGITLLAYHFRLVPTEEETLVSQLARTLVDRSPFYYVVQAATAGILFLAANTAFADFPRLAYFLARDRFLPHQFRFQGDRLAFSAGIVVLGVMTSLLVIARGASVSALIPLYAVGVFLAFTMSQTSMVVHWLRLGEGRRPLTSLAINGLGAATTAVVTLVIATTKFVHGAWIVVLLIPLLVAMMLGINRHYRHVAEQLRLSPAEIRRRQRLLPRHCAAVVPIASLNRASFRALEYARSIARDVTAVHVASEPESGEILRQRWQEAGLDIPLVIVESPYRELIGPLVAIIEKLHLEKGSPFITVVIPEFVPAHWWERLLHTQTAWRLRRALAHVPDLAVTGVPYHLAE